MESLLMTRRRGSHQPLFPPATTKTLFRMVDFATATDIKDKGPNAIAVTNYGVTVGSDAVGTFMNFGGAAYLNLTSTLLELTDLEIRYTIGEPVNYTADYGPPLLDNRPTGTNGNYYILAITSNAAKPYKFAINYPSTSYITTPAVTEFPARIRIKISSLPAGRGTTYLYVNDVLIGTLLAGGKFMTTYLKIGLSAYASVGVPYYRGKIYYFDICKA